MATVFGIDFSALTLKDALDLAILIEEEARERYEDFADQMEQHHTPEAGRFFRFMAAAVEWTFNRHRLLQKIRLDLDHHTTGLLACLPQLSQGPSTRRSSGCAAA